MIGTILLLGSVTFLGIGITLVLDTNQSALERWALGYLLGIGLFTYGLFLANWIGIPVQRIPAVGILLLMLSASYLLAWWRNKKAMTSFFQTMWQSRNAWRGFKIKKQQRVHFFLLFALFFVLTAVFVIASYWPVSNWDSIVLYDFRARLYAESGFMNYSIAIAYLGYPLLISLAHAWLYLFGLYYPGAIHSLFYCSFVALFYIFSRKKVAYFWALLWTIGLALSSPLIDNAFLTYTNLAYSVYLIVAIFYFLQWLETKRSASAIFGILALGLSTWTRSIEPFWLIPLGVFTVVSLKRKKFLLLIALLSLFFLLRQPWQFYKHQVITKTLSERHMSYTLADDQAALEAKPLWQRVTLQKVIDSGKYYYQYIIAPDVEYFILWILSLAIIVYPNKKRKILLKNDAYEWLIFLFIISFLGSVFAGIYYFSINYSDWQNIGGSATRMSLFIFPLILYFSTLTTNKIYRKLSAPRKVRRKK